MRLMNLPKRCTLVMLMCSVLATPCAAADAADAALASVPPGAEVRATLADGRALRGRLLGSDADTLRLACGRAATPRAYALADLGTLEFARGTRPSARRATALGIAGGVLAGAAIGGLAHVVAAGEPGGGGGGGSGGGDREARNDVLASGTGVVVASTTSPLYDLTLGAVLGGIAGGIVGAVTGLGMSETAWIRVQGGAHAGAPDGVRVLLALRRPVARR